MYLAPFGSLSYEYAIQAIRLPLHLPDTYLGLRFSEPIRSRIWNSEDQMRKYVRETEHTGEAFFKNYE